MSGDDTNDEAVLRDALEAVWKALNTAPTAPGEPTHDELRERVATNATKRFSVICLQCGLSVDRLIHAKTAQTEIDPAAYQRKCKIAPDAADFYCPELERAVERSRRWAAPIARSLHPASRRYGRPRYPTDFQPGDGPEQRSGA
jgi:hypothetical protein